MPTPVEVLILLKLADEASKEAAAAADKIAKKYKDLGANMQKIGAGMSVAITAPFILFSKNAIEGASGTEEALNKVRVVFGETAGDIEAFAKSAATSLGLSNKEALASAGTFGNLLKGMGLTGKATTEMSKDILALAADLGSFNDVPTAQVLENIRSGLVGEAEPMRKFGVLIDEAAVKSEAMALGLGGVGRELTQQEKVQARFSIIMKQTTTAQGDFARTADSLANSQKSAGAAMSNLSDEMGEILIPLAKEVTLILRGVMEAFMRLSPEVRTAILVVVGIVAVIGPLLIVIGTLLTVLPALKIAFLLLTGPIGLIIVAITLLAVAWATNMGDIQGKTHAVIGVIQDLFDGFKLFVLQLWRGIVVGIANAVNGIIGVVNGFIQGYNELAAKLGLPLIGKIELITPNLSGVDAAIAQVARDRAARITVRVGYIDPGPPALGRSYQHGSPFVPETGMALVHRGERIIPAHQNRPGGAASGPVVNINVEGSLIGLNADDIADRVGFVFTKQRRLQGLA